MKNKFSIRSQFDLLFEQLELFCDELAQSEILNALYFELPKVTKELENKAPTSIAVNTLSGELALTNIIKAYKDLFIDEKESGKIIQRHPGLVCVNDPNNELLNRLKLVNDAKQKFKSLILEIPNNDTRFEAVHNAVPSLITLASYRNIHFEDKTPYSVRFTWMTKHATRTLSKDAALGNALSLL